jgi:diketogulonate reductase-like aldo/keto reductase
MPHRRDQRKSSILAILAAQLSAAGKRGKAGPGPAKRRIPRRPYRDGVELSVIGLGGVVVSGLEQEMANQIVRESVERGVNYFDVAPTYGDAELKLGPALEPFRKTAFLACKTTKRDARGAREELHRSLDRLRTDHFDLYQFHGVSSMEDVERILSPGGAAEAFLEAREQGKVRFLGLSAHAEGPAIALMERFKCDSVLLPINFVCLGQGNFGGKVLEHAKRNGVTTLALKAMAYTPWPAGVERAQPKCWYKPVTDPDLARDALRFSLAQGITAAIPPGDEKLYAMALGLAPDLTPFTPDECEALVARAEGVDPLFKAPE